MYEKILYDKLIEYSKSGTYPLHMPGHKRNTKLLQGVDPFDIDITEITDFDNLHNAEGIIKESMENTAKYYGVKKTWYLVNGSSSGILAAIHSVTDIGDKILIGRNCHKSVYNAIETRNLNAEYVYPEFIDELNICGGYEPEKIREILCNNDDIKVVVITSPTYEGIVSDIEKIAEVVHAQGAILVVDEAHGAHFRVSDKLPRPAYECGADIVIESVHKTLPSLTQTALLHLNSDRVLEKKISKALAIYQTSSPSYLLMASIEKCIYDMSKIGEELANNLLITIEKMRQAVNNSSVRIVGKEIVGKNAVFDVDPTKLMIISEKYKGVQLAELLREKYGFEIEMEASTYVLGMTTVGDDLNKLDDLIDALVQIGKEEGSKKEQISLNFIDNKKVYSAYECTCKDGFLIDLHNSADMISNEYIYLYPPGIPLVVPGEMISEQLLNQIESLRKEKLNIIGINDNKIEVLEQ